MQSILYEIFLEPYQAFFFLFQVVACFLPYRILFIIKLTSVHLPFCFTSPHHPFSLSRSIKRIIFNSLVKPNVNEKGEKQMETISTSQALQIAGRAGRSASFLCDNNSADNPFELLLGHYIKLHLLPPVAGSPPSLKREKLQPCTETISPSSKKYSVTLSIL